MKKLIILIFIVFVGQAVAAQTGKTAPIMTIAFTDSLKHQITGIMPAGLKVKLLYTSNISAEGKLLRPYIMRQINDSDVSNDFVVKLRLLIINAPAWKPAFDNVLNKATDDTVSFTIVITKGEIVIEKKDKL